MMSNALFTESASAFQRFNNRIRLSYGLPLKCWAEASCNFLLDDFSKEICFAFRSFGFALFIEKLRVEGSFHLENLIIISTRPSLAWKWKSFCMHAWSHSDESHPGPFAFSLLKPFHVVNSPSLIKTCVHRRGCFMLDIIVNFNICGLCAARSIE